MTPARLRHLAVITLALLLVLLAWDTSDLDMRMAALFGSAEGFPLSEYWVLTSGFHEGGRLLSWLLVVALTPAVWWPWGPLRGLHARERVQLVVTALAAVLVVSSLKAFSTTSCPWDLSAFGGVARHVSHWSWLRDGGSGHCFPAGHASSGFAFVGGYFVWRRRWPAVALAWLAMALLMGFTLGIAQQVRGAHFMSHTLWTGWLCWSVALGVEAVLLARLNLANLVRRRAPPTPPLPLPAHRPAHADREPHLRG
ncbi:MAG: phosphatase PAP2 family protein [Cytophagales bacterium]|nr:phosphatase PAP2 family protein [Rhizobacter sp.]